MVATGFATPWFYVMRKKEQNKIELAVRPQLCEPLSSSLLFAQTKLILLRFEQNAKRRAEKRIAQEALRRRHDPEYRGPKYEVVMQSAGPGIDLPKDAANKK